jgi:hypothetical protein
MNRLYCGGCHRLITVRGGEWNLHARCPLCLESEADSIVRQAGAPADPPEAPLQASGAQEDRAPEAIMAIAPETAALICDAGALRFAAVHSGSLFLHAALSPFDAPNSTSPERPVRAAWLTAPRLMRGARWALGACALIAGFTMIETKPPVGTVRHQHLEEQQEPNRADSAANKTVERAALSTSPLTPLPPSTAGGERSSRNSPSSKRH